MINPSKTIHYTRILDLSHKIHPQIPLWAGDPAVEFQPVTSLASDGYYLRQFSMGEHSGTHINAPNSFDPEGKGIDRYPPEALVLPAIAINIQTQAEANPDYQLTIDAVLAWEKQYGQIAPDHLVLLYSGWQDRWPDPQRFLNADRQGKMHFPGFAGETTKFLITERAIAGVGIDTHGVDSGLDENLTTNRLILQQSGIVLENLTNLHQLPPTGTTIVIGRLPLQGGSGSPAAVFAFLP